MTGQQYIPPNVVGAAVQVYVPPNVVPLGVGNGNGNGPEPVRSYVLLGSGTQQFFAVGDPISEGWWAANIGDFGNPQWAGTGDNRLLFVNMSPFMLFYSDGSPAAAVINASPVLFEDDGPGPFASLADPVTYPANVPFPVGLYVSNTATWSGNTINNPQFLFYIGDNVTQPVPTTNMRQVIFA
jgi:hypothetical protein